MEPSDIVTLAGVFIGTGLAAYFGYFRKVPRAPQDPVLTGVGLELGNREQMERLIGHVKTIADCLSAMTDRRAIELEDMHQELLARLDMKERRAEQEEPRRRPDPPRMKR